MPKLYEYMGIIIFFYSNEHEPIHVHARYGEQEGRISFFLDNGQISHLEYENVTGKRPLGKRQRKLAFELAETLADEIIQSWINYFIFHKKVIFKNIKGKI